MTVIASYDIYGCKVLLADTLITTPQKNENGIVLPTLGERSATITEGKKYIACNLQKIQILSDYCVVAYAGNVYLAERFITALSDILKVRTISIIDIEKTYRDIDKNNELAIIYLYHAGDEVIMSGGINCKKTHSDTLGEVIYRGSGEEAITDYIKWLDNNNLYGNRPSNDELVAHSVCVGIQQISQLKLAEISSIDTPESIKEGFGSGYEIVSFYDGKFNKIDLTYVFIELTLNAKTGNVDINYPYLILSNYIDDGYLINDRYQQNNFEHIADGECIEYDYNQVITRSLLNFDNDIPEVFQENKQNKLNFCCFVFHDNFKNKYEMCQSIIMRSDTPPIIINKCEEEKFYQVVYSKQIEYGLIDFIEKNYL
ncbi:hypothetical protein [Rahnella aceris]